MPELEALQKHTLERPLTLPARADDLSRNLRNALREAADRGRLLHSARDIYALVKRIGPPPNVFDDLRARNLHVGAHCIVGGEKNQGRDREVAHIRRDDGAWFDFSITVREQRGGLELLAYDFEIRLPPMMGAPFLRFDYNLPEHRNEGRQLRCHLHPGCDDILLPAPLLSPPEMLAFFVEGLRMPGSRLGRQLSPFEVDWLKQSYEQACLPAGVGFIIALPPQGTCAPSAAGPRAGPAAREQPRAARWRAKAPRRGAEPAPRRAPAGVSRRGGRAGGKVDPSGPGPC